MLVSIHMEKLSKIQMIILVALPKMSRHSKSMNIVVDFKDKS